MTHHNNLGFTHLFYPGASDQPVLLLLHGTGGDEHDLVDLARVVAPDAGILSVRGNVLENGMPRFFKRLAEGVFDQDDLRLRTTELADFITAARDAYGLQDQKLYALGYSNGANIASSLLLRYPQVLDGAALVRGMVPFTPDALPDLHGKQIVLINGIMDGIVPQEQPVQLQAWYEQAGAQATLVQLPAGHQLGQGDLKILTDWFSTLKN